VPQCRHWWLISSRGPIFGHPHTGTLLTAPDRLHTALSGHYNVERELGTGGMATVYLARDVKHDRYVAIKVLHPELAAALGGERFLSEIKTTAKLQHPHILPLLDSGDADGLLYYVMPYVEGETLRARLERERQLPIAYALRIAREVADALATAHAHGIVHRDIKPENILLQGEHALVADFGIALAVQHAGGARMTQTGLSLGTPQYMSPEQAMGEKVIDARSDIYALGAVTYEMLVGEPPFTGPSVQAIVARLMSEDPRSIVAQRKAVSDQVEYAVMRALEKLPADRFATAHEFAEALTESGAAGSSTITHSSRAARAARGAVGVGRSRRKALVPLAGALLVGGLLAGTAAWTAASRRNDNRSISFTIEPPASGGVRQPTSDVRISPDGGTMAFIVWSDTASKLYVRSLSDVDAHPLSGANGVGTYAFAPDGERVAVMETDGKLRIMPLDGGPSVTLTQLQRYWSGVAWADNSTIVVGGQPAGGGLWLVSTTGVAPRQVFKAKQTFVHGYPLVADDGETVSFLDWGPGFTEDDYVAIGSLKTGKFETSKLLAVGIVGIVDGRVLYTTAGGALMAVRFDRRSYRLSGDPVHVMDGLTKINNPTASLSVSGTLMYVRGESTERLVLADSAGVHPLSTDDRTLLGPTPYNGTVRYSPDGRRIAVNVVEERSDSATSNIWTFDVATQTFSPLTTRGDVVGPEWTPDGRRLVFIRWFERKPGIWWQAADGSDSAESLIQLPEGETVYSVNVTPNGRGLVYCNGSLKSLDAYVSYMPFAGRVPERLLASDEGLSYQCGPRVSPDGRWLAYVLASGSQPQVYVRPFRSAGGRVQVSTDGGDSPVWSREGNRLYYRLAGGSLAVATMRADGPSLTVTKRERVPGAHDIALYDVAPDGKRILMAQTSDAHKQIVVTTNWLSTQRARLR
jgi:serine/threonine protein kinase